MYLAHSPPTHLVHIPSDSDVTASPLTVVFQRAGFGAAVHVVNAVLLTAVLSATNSCFYASSRMLLSLARSGQAPHVFSWVTKRGVPIPALL
jgi:amino acid permease